MKRFWIGSAIAMIAIIALGFILNRVNKINECKDYLVAIGDSYESYCAYKEEYYNEVDPNSERAQTLMENANRDASWTLYLIRYMEDGNDPDLIEKCISKLSLIEMKNLDAAFDYYAEKIDWVTETYGTPSPQQ